MTSELELVRLDELPAAVPPGHWDVAARFVEEAGERLTVQICDMEADGGAEPHAHAAQDQMFIVLEGALTVTGRSELVVRGGEALRIPAGAVHGTANAGPGRARYLVLTYPAETP